MKSRLIKTRKEHSCSYCGKPIQKGLSRVVRQVSAEDGELHAFNYYFHCRCHYKLSQHEQRFRSFMGICSHPQEFLAVVPIYLPGNSMPEIDYDECRLCGAKII